MATHLKTASKYGTNDWFNNNLNISAAAERDRLSATETSQEAKYLRNESHNRSKWDQADNNTRLANRVDDVRRWSEILKQTQTYTEREIREEARNKKQMEELLFALNLPMEVNAENLVLGDARRGKELVADEADHLLNTEKEMLEDCRKQLQSQINSSNEEVCRLQEARQALIADIQDKNVAIDIDIDQYNLTENSADISYKPQPTRVPKGSVSVLEWQDHSKKNKSMADEAMSSSNQHREISNHVMNRVRNDVDSLAERVEFALKKRGNELKAALQELRWQKQQTEEEMADLANEIRKQEEAIQMKSNPQKLTETRLENRTERPNFELCLDAPYYGLCDEVKQLGTTKKALQEQLYRMQHAWNSLEQKSDRINKEIADKSHALRLEEQCLELRKKLGNGLKDAGKRVERGGVAGRGGVYRSDDGGFAASYKGAGIGLY